ncbi:hypothetical protein WDW37_18520 [Bdellovibrionota bacterium FG-1]
MPPHSRKKLLIYPQFQLLLIVSNLVILLSSFGILLGLVSQVFSKLGDMGTQLNLPPGHLFFTFIHTQANSLLLYLAIAVVLSCCLSVGVMLWLSHRLAGPMVRLRADLERMAQTGVIGEVKFRSNDFLQELPEAVNAALSKFR